MQLSLYVLLMPALRKLYAKENVMKYVLRYYCAVHVHGKSNARPIVHDGEKGINTESLL